MANSLGERAKIDWWCWKRRAGAFWGLASLLGLLACVPKPAGAKIATLEEFLQGGREQGLELENPFAVDPAIAAEVEKAVGRGGTSADRMRHLTQYLSTRGFEYQANHSLTANEAFRARKGDCMAYTNLYLGLARHLGVPAFFVHIDEARNYYEQDGLSFVSSHMAVGCAIQYYTVIVDFTEQKSEYTLALYDAVYDATAAGLFYNNLAVDHLLKGDLAYAERLLTYLLAALPNLKEAQNNLGVILMRQGRFDEALKVFQDAIQKHPDYQPLYINAVQAAKGAGQQELAKHLEAQSARFLRHDPFFIFNQGVALYQKKDFAGALADFRKILSRQPKSPMLYAWIAKAKLSSGDLQGGVESFKRAQTLAPYLPMLKSVREEFPALESVPLPPPDPEGPLSGIATPTGQPSGPDRVPPPNPAAPSP